MTFTMNQQIEAYKVMLAMQKFGGTFVKALAIAMSYADNVNLAKIKATWPEYWQQYLAMYENIKEEYPINPDDFK